MAAFHGKDGNVIWDANDGVNKTTLSNIQSWSCDLSADVNETTSMLDTWKTRVVGFKDWSASVEVLMDDTEGLQIPVSSAEPQPMGNTAMIELYFIYDTSAPSYKALYGSCKCVGTSVSVNSDGVPTVTYNFQGTGTLAYHSGVATPSY